MEVSSSKVLVALLSRPVMPNSATLWIAAHQALLSMRFFQARILEWVAISFSRGSSQPRDRTLVSCTAARLFIN